MRSLGGLRHDRILRHNNRLLYLLGEMTGLGRYLLDSGQRLDRGETGELEALSGDLGFCRGNAD